MIPIVGKPMNQLVFHDAAKRGHFERLAGPMPRWSESLGFHEAMLGHQMGPKKVGAMMLQTPKRKKYEKMRTYVNSYYY